MPMSGFERALWEKERVAFSPNMSFRGEVRNMDGSELNEKQLDILKWMIEPVSATTQEIHLSQPDRFSVADPIIAPKTVISFSGMPNAAARVSGSGELEINLGILFAFASLPATYQLLTDMLRSTEMDISDLQSFRPPNAVISELDGLMGAWDSASRSGWRSIGMPRRFAEPGSLHRRMVFLVIGHELTHWFETIYKDAEWARMMKEVDGHYHSWLKEEKLLVRPEVLGNARRLLKDRAVLSNWVRETHADCGAYDYAGASATFGGWVKGDEARRKLMQINVNMAIFFWLNSLLELYTESRGGEIDVTTHPPAAIRRAIFVHIQAKKQGMSQQEFLFRQFGAGIAAGFLLERIAEEYLRTRHLRARA